MPDPTYRQATEADAPAIAAAGAEIWAKLGPASALRGLRTPEDVADRIASYSGRSAMFASETGGMVIGFALLETDPADPEQGIMGVWVAASERRKGVGRELALMAIDFARSAGYRGLRGTLPEGNEPALSFFSESGSLAQVVGGGMAYELPL